MYWHKAFYRIDIDEAEFDARLDKLIDLKKDATLLNHAKEFGSSTLNRNRNYIMTDAGPIDFYDFVKSEAFEGVEDADERWMILQNYEERLAEQLSRGSINKDGFYYYRIKFSPFDPTFTAKRFKVGDVNALRIQVQMNPFGLLVAGLLTVFIISAFVPAFIRQSGAPLNLWLVLALCIGFISSQCVAMASYYTSKNQTLEQLAEYLGMSKVKLREKDR